MKTEELLSRGFEKCATCGKVSKVFYYVDGLPFCSYECAVEDIVRYKNEM